MQPLLKARSQALPSLGCRNMYLARANRKNVHLQHHPQAVTGAHSEWLLPAAGACSPYRCDAEPKSRMGLPAKQKTAHFVQKLSSGGQSQERTRMFLHGYVCCAVLRHCLKVISLDLSQMTAAERNRRQALQTKRQEEAYAVRLDKLVRAAQPPRFFVTPAVICCCWLGVISTARLPVACIPRLC